MDSLTLTARWLFPVDAPPLEQGTITICGERIQAVEPRGARGAELDLGNVAILPGLVNAHTHLDFAVHRHPWRCVIDDDLLANFTVVIETVIGPNR